MQRVFRPQGAAEFLGMGLSTFEKARRDDPDFQNCRAIQLGARSIGFDFDDLLRVYLRKVCRRDGIPADRLDAEVERRVIQERAREEVIAEARTHLRIENRKICKRLVAA